MGPAVLNHVVCVDLTTLYRWNVELQYEANGERNVTQLGKDAARRL